MLDKYTLRLLDNSNSPLRYSLSVVDLDSSPLAGRVPALVPGGGARLLARLPHRQLGHRGRHQEAARGRGQARQEAGQRGHGLQWSLKHE